MSVKLRMQWVRTRIAKAGGFDACTVAQLESWTSFARLPVRRLEGSGDVRKIDYAYAVGLRAPPGTIHPSRVGVATEDEATDETSDSDDTSESDA